MNEATRIVTEQGADGFPQYVVPGTETNSAELAKRRALAPLKPKVGQFRCDIGLFGDEAKQIDLTDYLA